MSSSDFESVLREIALGGFRFYESISSTNDSALEWASNGAPDLALVVADGQVRGRGRDGRQWFSFPGAGLAFSLVLRPIENERNFISRFSGLGALALVNVLKSRGLPAEIKWPNDVLIGKKKTAGILIETTWIGSEIECLVLGMGVNILPGSLPPQDVLNYPATCVESELAASLSRYDLLRDLLMEIINLRKNLNSVGFLSAWQDALAFRGENVQLWQAGNQSFTAELLGLESDGSLRVRMQDGRINAIHFGEVHMRPFNA